MNGQIVKQWKIGNCTPPLPERERERESERETEIEERERERARERHVISGGKTGVLNSIGSQRVTVSVQG